MTFIPCIISLSVNLSFSGTYFKRSWKRSLSQYGLWRMYFVRFIHFCNLLQKPLTRSSLSTLVRTVQFWHEPLFMNLGQYCREAHKFSRFALCPGTPQGLKYEQKVIFYRLFVVYSHKIKVIQWQYTVAVCFSAHMIGLSLFLVNRILFK